MRLVALIIALILGAAGTAFRAEAQGRPVLIPTRPGIQTGAFWVQVENAKGTVLFFPGGFGGLGMTATSTAPTANNYIADTHVHLAANGYNVLMFGLPSDSRFLNIFSNGRVSDDHLADIRAFLAYIRKQSTAPVWLMGFSAGAVSAAFAAVRLQDADLAGLVLTSSVFRANSGRSDGRTLGATVSSMELERLRIPVLIYHHAKDECGNCVPADAREAFTRLANAPVRKLIMATGGANPSGDPCYNRHWHGFPGMERAALDEMAGWMERPVP